MNLGTVGVCSSGLWIDLGAALTRGFGLVALECSPRVLLICSWLPTIPHFARESSCGRGQMWVLLSRFRWRR